MAILQILGFMTGQTDLVRFILKQLTVHRLMRAVAGITLSLGIRIVSILIFLQQFVMATKAGRAQLLLEKPVSGAHMRLMAGKALSAAHRLMDHTLLECFLLLLMTGKAESGTFLFQQPLKMCHMRIMAGAALALGQWLMDNLAAESLLFVAVKADGICCSCYGQNYGKPGNDNYSIII
jgi:hypothetical protein